jgi:hypothetical protein
MPRTGIYFESKSEPLAGQLAVGKVIANRAKRRPLPVRPIAACCSSAANSRSFAAARCRRCRAPASSGRPRSRSPRSSTRPAGIGGRQRAVLPRALRVAGLAAEARRVDRQPHLLPLAFQLRVGSGRASARPLSFVVPLCSSVLGAMATQPDSLCFTDAPPIAAEVARGVTRCSAARTCSRSAKCRCPTAAAPT